MRATVPRRYWFLLSCQILFLGALLMGAPSARAELRWQSGAEGPGKLGGVAEIALPEGYLFVGQDQMPELNQLTGNLHNPNDLGAITSSEETSRWLIFFSFDASGYVKDDDKDDLDAKAMLESFQESDEATNKVRQEQGLPLLYTDGWQTPPYYDPQTHNLTWALKLRNAEGKISINHNVRLLGRRGVMEVILVASPEEIEKAIQQAGPLMGGVSFIEGQRYADFVSGDQVAEYGLAGLVLGGGAVLAAKAGLFKILLKNVKLVILAIGGAAMGVVRLFKKKDSASS